MSHSIPNSTVGFLAPKTSDSRGNFVCVLSRPELRSEICAPKDVKVSSPEMYGGVSENTGG